MTEKSNRGGKREGSGRKATGAKKYTHLHMKIDPKLKAKAVKQAGGNLSQYIIWLIKEDLNII